jgi:membrane-bound serine protease (ClpP class)
MQAGRLRYVIFYKIPDMRKKIWILFLLVFCSFFRVAHAQDSGRIIALKIAGAINPAVAEYITGEIQRAEENGDVFIVIEMDTPGGLDTSMRIIVKEILGSSVPVAVFVSPDGSRAASAGTFITMAGHVAVMAPGTSIGAAHPVSMGGQKMDEHMAAKVENDAVSYIRSIAEKRRRNAHWAELAVRESVSISETEAKRLGVIDFVAKDLNSLIMAVDGTEVTTNSGTVKLDLKNRPVKAVEMTGRLHFLNTLSDPNIAYMLMLIGMVGLYFELSNPGLILPGVVGAISLILALYSFQTLPINYAGLLLIVLGLILFIAEIKVMSYGLLSVGGVISILLGSLMLIDSNVPSYLQLSRSLIFSTVGIASCIVLGIIGLTIKSAKRKVVSGYETMIGEEGEARTDLNCEGEILVQGEIWHALSREPVEKGGKVIVEAIEGLKAIVRKKVF